MRGALTVTTVSGIAIRVHASFALILALNAWQWSDFGARGALFGAVLSSFVFVCVVLHELGHSLVAKAFGISVRDITLYPIGGVASLGSRPGTPVQELLIAVAGPAVNVVIATALATTGLLAFGSDAFFAALERSHEHAPTGLMLWAWLAASNALLAVFNMLPALPMDGGRVLRAVLSWFVGPQKATTVSAFIARVLAAGLFALGLFSGQPMMAIIAMFVFSGAGQEVAQQRMGQVLDRVQVGDVVSPYSPRFTPATTLGEAVRMLTMTHSEAIAVEHFGRLVGVVTAKDILRGAAEQGAWGYVAALVQKVVPVIDAREPMESARFKMDEAGLPYVAVVRDGIFMGLVTELELALVADRVSSVSFQRDGTARVGQHRNIS